MIYEPSTVPLSPVPISETLSRESIYYADSATGKWYNSDVIGKKRDRYPESGNCLYLEGSTRINFGASGIPGTTTKIYGVSFWLKAVAAGSVFRYWSWFYGDVYGDNIWYNNTYGCWAGQTTPFSRPTGIAGDITNWHHHLHIYRNPGMDVYVDGVKVFGTQTITVGGGGTLVFPSPNFRYFGYDSGTLYTTGWYVKHLIFYTSDAVNMDDNDVSEIMNTNTLATKSSFIYFHMPLEEGNGDMALMGQRHPNIDSKFIGCPIDGTIATYRVAKTALPSLSNTKGFGYDCGFNTVVNGSSGLIFSNVPQYLNLRFEVNVQFYLEASTNNICIFSLGATGLILYDVNGTFYLRHYRVGATYNSIDLTAIKVIGQLNTLRIRKFGADANASTYEVTVNGSVTTYSENYQTNYNYFYVNNDVGLLCRAYYNDIPSTAKLITFSLYQLDTTGNRIGEFINMDFQNNLTNKGVNSHGVNPVFVNSSYPVVYPRVPIDLHSPKNDVLGRTLYYSRQVQFPALVKSPCANFDGTAYLDGGSHSEYAVDNFELNILFLPTTSVNWKEISSIQTDPSVGGGFRLAIAPSNDINNPSAIRITPPIGVSFFTTSQVSYTNTNNFTIKFFRNAKYFIYNFNGEINQVNFTQTYFQWYSLTYIGTTYALNFKYLGKFYSFKYYQLDSSGNRINTFIDLDFRPQYTPYILNKAANAPSYSYFYWTSYTAPNHYALSEYQEPFALESYKNGARLKSNILNTFYPNPFDAPEFPNHTSSSVLTFLNMKEISQSQPIYRRLNANVKLSPVITPTHYAANQYVSYPDANSVHITNSADGSVSGIDFIKERFGYDYNKITFTLGPNPASTSHCVGVHIITENGGYIMYMISNLLDFTHINFRKISDGGTNHFYSYTYTVSIGFFKFDYGTGKIYFGIDGVILNSELISYGTQFYIRFQREYPNPDVGTSVNVTNIYCLNE